jgi:hypothetical protein
LGTKSLLSNGVGIATVLDSGLAPTVTTILEFVGAAIVMSSDNYSDIEAFEGGKGPAVAGGMAEQLNDNTVARTVDGVRRAELEDEDRKQGRCRLVGSLNMKLHY